MTRERSCRGSGGTRARRLQLMIGKMTKRAGRAVVALVPGVAAVVFATISCKRPPEPQPARPVLRLTLPYEPETLDPHQRNFLSDFAVASNFYEPLVLTDADGRVRPGLAWRWESPDSLHWIFHLRPGVNFHSGR